MKKNYETQSEPEFSPENEKPPILYHASENRDIKEIAPRNESIRDENEGSVVFATPDLGLVSAFMMDLDDSWVKISRFNGINCVVISDKDRFLEFDKGGAIYSLPSDSFESDPNKGMGEFEWTSRRSIEPNNKIIYESAFEAMLENGVQVFFTDEETLDKIRNAKDHGIGIIKTLKSENQIRGINEMSLKDIESEEE